MADDSADGFEASPSTLLTSLRSQTINLAAGPSSLPTPVLLKATAGLLDYEGTGIGLTELSHRSSTFMNLCKRTESDLRQLLAIPDNFAVLFLQGGGLTQFSMTALNMLAWYKLQHQDQKDEPVTAEYIITGSWSAKAAGEAKRLGIASRSVTDSRTLNEKKSFGSVAPESDWSWSSPNDPKPAYIYYCANETVNGVEIPPPSSIPSHLADVPIVADMSSNILSKPIPWESNFGIIYAGAQKNVGPAGLTLCFVRKDLLVDPDEAVSFGGPRLPAMMAYKNIADNDSLYNTPPMFPIYVAGLVFEHLKGLGGVKAIDALNEEKANRVYGCIDGSDGFYVSKVDKGCRSRMNVVFVLAGGADQEKRFLAEADKVNIKQIKGHRSVGGQSCRCLY